MKTKVILQDRSTGKTTRAIKMAHEEDLYILVPNEKMARYISEMSQDMGLEIRFPLLLQDLEPGRISRQVARKGIIVDEGLMILKELLGVPIRMMTLSDEAAE